MARHHRGDELTRWSPLQELEELSDRFNRMISRFPAMGELGESTRMAEWAPRADVRETENEFRVTAELPGVKKDDVKVSVEEGRLILRGERKEEHHKDTETTHRVEREYGTFYRSFALPENIDRNKVEAEFHDGVLEVHLPKTRKGEHAARTIEIR